MIDIRLEENIGEAEVTGLLKSSRFQSLFGTTLWIDILLSSFPGFSAGWITAREGGSLIGLMPVIFKKIFSFHCIRSLPFGTYGNPLSSEDRVKRLLVEKFLKLAARPRCLDAVCTIFDVGWKEWFPDRIHCQIAESRIAELEGGFEDYLARKVNATKRKAYRKCSREGIEISPLESFEEIALFHRIYESRASGWGGIHPLPLLFFENLFAKGGDRVVFMGAYADGKLLGGHVDLYFGNMAQAWQAGVSKEANRYGVAPCLVLEAVREAYSRGIEYFNMGSSGGDKGLIDFKESMGGARITYPLIIRGKRWWKLIRKR